MLVDRVASLRDHAFPAFVARTHPGLGVVDHDRTLQRRLEGNRSELRSPLVERERAQIAAIAPEDVEDVIRPAVPAPLTVENELAMREPRDRRCDRRNVLLEAVREYMCTSLPRLNVIMRMPSYLRSNVHSGPVKRSFVSVAAIGTSQSGKSFACSFVMSLLRE